MTRYPFLILGGLVLLAVAARIIRRAPDMNEPEDDWSDWENEVGR